jgi:enoyl-CoA hydratase/carnithine racemase
MDALMTNNDSCNLVTFEIHGALARLRINNPPLNILTRATRGALLKRVCELEEREDIKVIIIQGGEKAFSVGSDVREFPEDPTGGLEKIRFEQYVLDRLAQLRQVTVAQLRGYVLGGGAELMLSCDLRVASEQAQIGFPEIRLGALPAAGGMRRLARDIGPVRARELILRGHTISAREAVALGLINNAVPEIQLEEVTEALAGELLKLPSDALRWGKKCIEAVFSTTGVDTIEAEAFVSLFRGRNLREGLAAFLEKRAPSFE